MTTLDIRPIGLHTYHYNRQRVYVLLLMTHAEYGKDNWKKSL